MPQKLARREREELQRLLQGTFGEQEVQTLLAVLERVALRGGSRSVRQDLQELQSLATQLVEGQQGLQAALEHLAQAQARTEARVDELAQAQARTERALQDLTQQVGGLSETVGGDIEDIAYIVLHDVLKRECGWQIGVLERSWQQWNGQPVEINVFGQAIDPGPPQRSIWIVGEAKHNLTLREVERFAL